MNKIFIGIIMLILTSVINPLTIWADEDQLIRDSLKQFFAVLKSGNVIAIEAAIGGDILKETKVLLKENKEYNNFLKKYYQNAEFQVDKIVQVPNNGAIADVSVIFSNEDIQQFQFILNKEPKNEKSEGKWKIVRQRSKK